MEHVEVSVEELLGGLKRRGVPLPFEIGAFIALEACEQMVDRPVRLAARDIGIGDIGEVVCATTKSPVNEESAVRALLLLLSELLMASAPGVPAMLLELVERGPRSGEWRLDRLREDLEASLVPLNRGATRRVLARLAREARKAGLERPARTSVVPAAAEIDAQFDALMALGDGVAQPLTAAGAGPAPGPPRAATQAAVASAFAAPVSGVRAPAVAPSPTPRGSFSRDDDAPTTELAVARPPRAPGTQAASLRALRSAAAGSSEPPPPPAATPRPSSSRGVEADVQLRERGDPARVHASERARRRTPEAYEAIAHEDGDATGRTHARADDLLSDMPEREGSRAPFVLGLGLAVVAVALAGAYMVLGQDGARRVLGLSPVAEGPLPEVPAASARKPPVAGELLVSSQPDRAQVLLFVGRGPALATDLPIGVAQEFVATADGYAPARALVPADAQWETVPGEQARYELAMQPRRLEPGDSATELGPTLLPRDVGAPSGSLGTARIVTTPKAAKVYQLIGFTPDVRVENLPLDTSYEVLVYLPGYGLETRRLEPSDFAERDGKRAASLTVSLAPEGGRRRAQ